MLTKRKNCEAFSHKRSPLYGKWLLFDAQTEVEGLFNSYIPGVYLLAAVLAIEVLSFAIKAKVMTINSKPVVME